MSQNIKIAMMKAASKALDYKKTNRNADVEEILGFVMAELQEKGNEKIGAIAAATKALKYKEQSNFSDRQILQKIMDESGELLTSMALE